MTNVMCMDFKVAVSRGDEERDAVLTLRVSGRHAPATWGYSGGDPAESPEVEVFALVDCLSGEDVDPADIAPSDLEHFEELALEAFMDSYRGAL